MSQSPPYTLVFEPRVHYLYARVTGPEDTAEVSIAYWAEIASECHARGTERLLVEERLEGNSTVADMEQVVDGLLALGFHDIRVAFVDATEDAALLIGSEIRVQQHGLSGRVFRRIAEAEGWLLADLPPLAD
ncbi:MAG: hypothetical protein EPO46_05015 [Lysobacter sp.]|nr:MAG: hypothetical protein EPO46_05015 [Lysobacter sp.]